MAWQALGLIVIGVSYLLGSIPTGYLMARWLKGIDIRQSGSGSTGATNVLRTIGKGPAAFVLAFDAAKGAIAVLLSQWLYSVGTGFPNVLTPEWLACLAGLFALLGHSKPIWLKFQGGKSVASGLGVLFALNWVIALETVAAFAVTLAFFRIVSLGSIVAAIAVNVLMWGTGQPLAFKFFALLGGGYILIRHRSNMQRLLAGQEPKIGQPLPQQSANS